MNPDGSRPIALITGATRPGRVGDTTARLFARLGFDLVLPSRDPAAGTDSSWRASPFATPTAVSMPQLDLGDLDAVDRLAHALNRDLPRLDVLVLNASIYEPTALDAVTPAALERAMRINAFAPLLLARGLAPLLSRGGRGSIVALTDLHALGAGGQTAQTRRGFMAYSMSKAALSQMVLALARELAPSVRVNAVAPGVVAFPNEGHESDRAMQDRYLARVPLARSGTVEEAAEAIRWLALDATYCTGVIIRLDGGRGTT